MTFEEIRFFIVDEAVRHVLAEDEWECAFAQRDSLLAVLRFALAEGYADEDGTARELLSFTPATDREEDYATWPWGPMLELLKRLDAGQPLPPQAAELYKFRHEEFWNSPDAIPPDEEE